MKYSKNTIPCPILLPGIKDCCRYKAAAIIAISENTKKDLVEIFNIPETKVHATQLASDFNKVLPSIPQNGEGLKNFVLFTGTRWGYKNFYFCVTALSEIFKNDPNLKLLCTGHPFDIHEQKFFKDLGIQDQVIHIYLKDDREFGHWRLSSKHELLYLLKLFFI